MARRGPCWENWENWETKDLGQSLASLGKNKGSSVIGWGTILVFLHICGGCHLFCVPPTAIPKHCSSGVVENRWEKAWGGQAEAILAVGNCTCSPLLLLAAWVLDVSRQARLRSVCLLPLK